MGDGLCDRTEGEGEGEGEGDGEDEERELEEFVGDICGESDGVEFDEFDVGIIVTLSGGGSDLAGFL
jgi:hypothetical protein